MAFALDEYIATSEQTDFIISFSYQAQEDIKVIQNGSTLTVTIHYIFSDATTIQLVTGATTGDIILLQRSTSRTSRDVNFTPGVLTESDLDNANIQTFFMAQEAMDLADRAMNLDETDGKWTARTKIIKNVTNPILDQDAATKNYVDSATLAGFPTPLTLALGGTSAANASDARDALGIQIGTSGSVLGLLDTDNTYSGANLFTHIATENDDSALRLEVDAAGFGDVKAIHIDYTTGSVAPTEAEAPVLVCIDETLTTGGTVNAIDVLTTTEGSAEIVGIHTGVGVHPMHHDVGTFGDMDSALNKAVDVLAALSSGGAGNISVFVADNDTMTIGDAAKFAEMEIIADTGASGGGIAPIFEYSLAGDTWGTFSPIDGTDGFKHTGIISWEITDLADWVVDGNTEFSIRITRTRNGLSTTPILDEVQIAATTIYGWDKNGVITAAEVPLPRGYIDGLILSQDTDTDHDIDIANGSTRDGSDSANILLTSTLVKQIDASWTLGTDCGGLDGTESSAGTPDASTWYHIWLIKRSDTGVVDALFSESATAPTMPTDYDQKRRIGAVLTDVSANILAFFQHGDNFYWVDAIEDVADNTPGTSANTPTMSVPTGIETIVRMTVRFQNDSTSQVLITAIDETDVAPGATTLSDITSTTNAHPQYISTERKTNTSAQIRYRSSDGTISILRIWTRGWIDPRGKNS
jgi:hypothetical protein